MEFPFPIELAIVAIIKNEGAYLREWLDYHLAAGVEHFYLYDNESEDNTQDIIAPYVAQGIVTCQKWPGKAQQLFAYAHALEQYRYTCRYMAFLDLDEFIVPRVNKPIGQIVRELLAIDKAAAGVTMNWRLFGSSGLNSPPPSVLQGFCHRAPDDFPQNKHVKIVVNPRRVRYMRTPHHAIYTYGWHAVDDAGQKIINTPYNPGNAAKILAVNHYFTKTKGEWLSRRSYARADTGQFRQLEEFYKNDRNDIYDDTAWQYLRARQGRQAAMPIRQIPVAAELLNHFTQELSAYPKQGKFAESTEDLCCFLAHSMAQQGAAADILCRVLSLMLSLNMKQGLVFWEFELIMELIARLNEAQATFGHELKTDCYQGLMQIIEHFRLEGDSLQEAYFWRRTQFFHDTGKVPL
ncbi:MAG: glycosyltransferase family 92 protein [Selenomonadaceae bacterium]|nr:glycosyltransferase family 92 protein [Selenomonadaceae bacterium]